MLLIVERVRLIKAQFCTQSANRQLVEPVREYHVADASSLDRTCADKSQWPRQIIGAARLTHCKNYTIRQNVRLKASDFERTEPCRHMLVVVYRIHVA